MPTNIMTYIALYFAIGLPWSIVARLLGEDGETCAMSLFLWPAHGLILVVVFLMETFERIPPIKKWGKK